MNRFAVKSNVRTYSRKKTKERTPILNMMEKSPIDISAGSLEKNEAYTPSPLSNAKSLSDRIYKTALIIKQRWAAGDLVEYDNISSIAPENNLNTSNQILNSEQQEKGLLDKNKKAIGSVKLDQSLVEKIGDTVQPPKLSVSGKSSSLEVLY